MCIILILLQLLWFLCAVIAFPTASGLLWYSCQDYPGSNQPCGNPSVRKCEVNHDSCMSATVQYNGMRSTTTIKNCTTTLLCLLNICDKLDHNLTTMDMKTAACAVSCCHGDLCNGEEGSCFVFIVHFVFFIYILFLSTFFFPYWFYLFLTHFRFL